jgi:copper resistance protein B
MNRRHVSGVCFALGVALVGLAPIDAWAQQMDPNMRMPMSMPMPATKPAAERKPARKAKPAKPTATSRKPRPHTPARRAAAGHDHHGVTMPATPSTPVDHAAMGHSGAMPAGSMPAMDHATMDHATMDHATMDHDGMSMAPSLPRTPIPVLTDADRAAARPPAHDHPVHDNSIQSYTLVDRLETWDAGKGAGLGWNGKAWIGTDLNRLWLRSEGERIDARTESADLEVLYGHSVATWWDVVAGVRHDFKPGASQDFAAIGLTGLAPYKFEVDATAYIGQSGQTAARVEVEYETLLTNRLILQPRVELNLFGQDDARRGIGSGLGTIEAGVRLRYEFTRRFAPYIGLVSERAFGDTANLRRGAGADVTDTRFVAGVRLWF